MAPTRIEGHTELGSELSPVKLHSVRRERNQMSDKDQWEGLPLGNVYCWTWGKAPKYSEWNRPQNLFSLEELRQGKFPKHTNPTAPTGFGMVSGRWSGTLAVDFDANPEMPDRAEETFQNVTGHPSSHLPASATVISGRPGRRRVFLKVPEIWWPSLSGYSASLMDLEIRWEAEDAETRHPKPIQSVISGPHPDNHEWYFRWAEGLRPQDVGFQDAPTWLLIAIVRQRGVEIGLKSDEGRGGGSSSDGPGYMDQLDPRRQKQLLELFSEKWPYRGGKPGTRFQASWTNDSFQGLLAALNNVLGPVMAEQWLENTKWFSLNEDWGSHSDFKEALRSLGRSKTVKEAGWGTLHYLATRTEDSQGNRLEGPPAVLPPWALPPRDLVNVDIYKESAKLIVDIEEVLAQIDKIDHPAQRLLAQQELTRKLGKSSKEMQQILQTLEAGEEAARSVSADELLKSEKIIRPAIQGLLARGCLTVMASQGGVAKTSLCYRMGMAMAAGEKFAGQMQAERGGVLIIQKDESPMNAQQKLTLMDFKDYPKWVRDQIQFRFDWNPGMFPELKQWIKESEAAVVFLDSLGTLLGGGGLSLNDAECALYLYRLNALAAETDTAIVLTHHTKKRQQEQKNKKGEESDGPAFQRTRLSDLYGSSYIVNAASDVWGVCIDGGDPNYPMFALEVLKARSGVTQKDDLFLLEGDLNNLSFTFKAFNFREKADELTGTAKEKALKLIRGRNKDTAVTEADIKMLIPDLSDSTIKRVVRQIYGERQSNGVDRVSQPGNGKGRPAFAYYLAQ